VTEFNVLITGLSEEPKPMTISHDRLILQHADRDGGLVVVVKCPHTIGLCFELEEPDGFLGMLPCPCNDRSQIVARVVAVEDLHEAWCDGTQGCGRDGCAR
jgi:hypothetical protein